MSDKAKVRTIRRLAKLVVLVMVFSPLGLSQEDARPTYEVANLLDLEQGDAVFYADRLRAEIENLRGGGCEAPHKNLGDCCQVHPKAHFCEVVFAKLEVLSGKGKRVRVYVEEHLPSRKMEGELITNLTCSPSQTNVDCYRTLLKRMAGAVKEHDQQCHSGKKCHIEDGKFVND